jgi:hypothetical protein
VTVEVVGVGSAAVAPLSLSEAGSWLCDRHPELAELVQRIGHWRDGEPDMPRVRNAVVDYDAAVASNSMPQKAMRMMTPSEVNRLRLLGTLAPRSAFYGRLQFCVSDLQGFDRSTGGPLIEDWLRCVRIGVIG